MHGSSLLLLLPNKSINYGVKYFFWLLNIGKRIFYFFFVVVGWWWFLFLWGAGVIFDSTDSAVRSCVCSECFELRAEMLNPCAEQ